MLASRSLPSHGGRMVKWAHDQSPVHYKWAQSSGGEGDPASPQLASEAAGATTLKAPVLLPTAAWNQCHTHTWLPFRTGTR